MYDLTKFTLRDMVECGLALRELGTDCSSMEEASQKIVRYFHENFSHETTNAKSSALVRFFKTHSYQNLEPHLQAYARNIAGNEPDPAMKCMTLLATAGEQPEWNLRQSSTTHQAIPLVSEELVAQSPMIAQLITQLGLDIKTVLQPNPNLLIDLEQKKYNVFFVKEALGSPYIPAQESFVIPYGIQSVLGCGGILSSGNMFAVIIFLKTSIPTYTAKMFSTLALNIKTAVLPFEGKNVFATEAKEIASESLTPEQEREQLRSQVLTLTQLLDVSEQSTIEQSDRLEQAIAELSNLLDHLQATQSKLIESEKMAVLARLVAGIAHEINTPVGIGVTAASVLEGKTATFQKKYQSGNMKRSDLEDFLHTAVESSHLILVNLQRAAELVHSFKQVAVDQSSEEKRHFPVKQYVEEIILHLSPKINTSQHKVVVEGDETVQITTYPGALSQVIANLVMNSLLHAYKPEDKGQISLSIFRDNEKLFIEYADDGQGIPKDIIQQIFDPFFTTKRGQGGSGLGLNIVYNLVTQKLSGEISCESQVGKGTRFLIYLPLSENAQ